MQKPNIFSCVLLLLASASSYGENPKDTLRQKLVSEYALTVPTADNTDIATPGAVLVLRRGDIVMGPVSSATLPQTIYKNGQLSQDALGKMNHWLKSLPGQRTASQERTFVPGEKLWVTKIDINEDGILFGLFTDAYANVRYKAALKFYFSKGSIPSVGQAERLIAEVFGIDANRQHQDVSSSPQSSPVSSGVPVAQSPQEASVAPVAPPEQAPATIGLGATPDQVIAALGQPQNQFKIRNKLIYVYKNLKVTFIDSKVTDIQ